MFTTGRAWAFAATLAATVVAAPAYADTTISFYYPVAVGGPITKIVDGYAAEFSKENPGIIVKPVYSGSYQDTVTKILTAAKGGDAPQLAVMLSTDMFTLIDEDVIVPIDQIATTPDDKKWMDSFFPAFMENSREGGHVWGIPFQRSTIVLFYNKEMFTAAGLDPEKPPATWDDIVAFGQKLTRHDGGGTTQWGIEIPSSGFPYWLFQGLTTANDAILMNPAGTETYFDKPGVVEALQYWVDLSKKYGIQPGGVIDWGTTPKDFFEKKVAMIETTTGNLTNVKANAGFPFGVAMLPKMKRFGSPTGGGNLYLFKSSTPAQQAAALKFAKWLTTPERAARWGIDTGYVAVRPDAWDTPEMKQYLASFPPAAVARDQLKYAVAELSTHDNQRVAKALNDALQAALTGANTPGPALKAAQAEADRLLRPYR